MTTVPPQAPAEPRVKLTSAGLRLDSLDLALHCGSVHYWRLEPQSWRSALVSLKSLGCKLVDTYVPWGVHETAPGEFDFGIGDPRLDLAAFLGLVHELGLFAIVRPGPHINAELTWFGIPERVIWDKACQARGPRGAPVVLPVPPLAFPVPSYASEAFQTEAAEWLRAFAAVAGGFVWPEGPIVLYQIDNEGALYFRDGVYDQDYHPDALNAYRRFLQQKYPTLQELRSSYADPAVTFAKVEPPKRLNANVALELAPHLDWAEFQEQLLGDAFSRMRAVLNATPFARLPCSHNLPLSEGATPLDPPRILQAVDFVGLDYYHGASPPQRSEIARRTSELAVRCANADTPAFANELGAGFPPFFPPLAEHDNTFTALTALAYGLRGFNIYMAVERDRWIGAPIDQFGRRRQSSDFWQKLTSALDRTRFAELQRKTPVQIIVPRSFRRLARVLHAFGPLSAALFQVLGGSPEEACFEDELGLGSSVVIDAQRFTRAIESALESKGLPYAFAPGDLVDTVMDQSEWTIIACTGALDPDFARRVARAIERGRNVTIGPFAPERDHSFRVVDQPLSLLRPPGAPFPTLLPLDGDAIKRAVDDAAALFAQHCLSASPDQVFVTLHVNAAGEPKVLFVINPASVRCRARVGACGARTAEDCLTGERLAAKAGSFELEMQAHSVRMLELGADS